MGEHRVIESRMSLREKSFAARPGNTASTHAAVIEFIGFGGEKSKPGVYGLRPASVLF